MKYVVNYSEDETVCVETFMLSFETLESAVSDIDKRVVECMELTLDGREVEIAAEICWATVMCESEAAAVELMEALKELKKERGEDED